MGGDPLEPLDPCPESGDSGLLDVFFFFFFVGFCLALDFFLFTGVFTIELAVELRVVRLLQREVRVDWGRELEAEDRALEARGGRARLTLSSESELDFRSFDLVTLRSTAGFELFGAWALFCLKFFVFVVKVSGGPCPLPPLLLLIGSLTDLDCFLFEMMDLIGLPHSLLSNNWEFFAGLAFKVFFCTLISSSFFLLSLELLLSDDAEVTLLSPGFLNCKKLLILFCGLEELESLLSYFFCFSLACFLESRPMFFPRMERIPF